MYAHPKTALTETGKKKLVPLFDYPDERILGFRMWNTLPFLYFVLFSDSVVFMALSLTLAALQYVVAVAHVSYNI